MDFGGGSRPARVILEIPGIEEIEHEARRSGLAPGPPDALRLDVIRGVPQAGRVDEPEADAFQGQDLLQGVAGRARRVGDDGPVLPKEGVEQGGLAAVGGAEDGHGHALGNGPAGREAAHQLVNAGQQ